MTAIGGTRSDGRRGCRRLDRSATTHALEAEAPRSWAAAGVVVMATGAVLLGIAAGRWFTPIDAVGIGDWDQFISDAWLAGAGFRERGWPAFWAVQISGGAPLLGDPQSLSSTPLLVLPLVFGPIIGVKLIVVLAMAAGLVGWERLGREWIGDRFGASVFSVAFVFCAYFAIHLRAGHLPWAMFHMVAWVLLFVERVLVAAERRPRDVAALIAAAALLFSGPIYHPLVFLLLPLLGIAAVTRWRDTPLRRVRWVLGGFAAAAMITMPRWIAIIDWQWRSPREVIRHGGLPLSDMPSMLFDAIADYRIPVAFGHSGVWEYWSFIGVTAALLAALALVLAPGLRRFLVSLAMAGVVLAWRSPWGTLLEAIAPYVPLVHSVRVYSRFLGLVVFAVLLGAGATVGALHRRGGRWSVLAVGLALLLFTESAVVVASTWADVFAADPRVMYQQDWGLASVDPPFSQVRTAPPVQRASATADNINSRMLPLLQAGYVVRRAYSALALPPVDLRAGPVVGGGIQPRYRIRNHRIDLWGDFQPGQLLVVRLRYVRHYNWKVARRKDAGLERHDGMIGIRILRPTDHVELRMRRSAEVPGWICSAIGLVAAVVLVRRAAATGTAEPVSPA